MTLYFRNQIHGLVTGYGEKPLRPVIASSTVIGVFAVLYWLLWTISSTPQPEGYGGVYGPLILSAESFTTLVIGGGSVNQSSIQLLAYTEGFLGAFLIALFVFTLTRSVHR
jgi:stage V sporulation protein SpoVS